MNAPLPELVDLDAARKRIEGKVHRTPVMRSRRLDNELGAQLFFKCENLQRTASFKIRGATNAVAALTSSNAARGVATHSSGNHGAALAAAASDRNIPSYVVVPRGSVPGKVAAIAGYGGEVIECGPTLADRETVLGETLTRTGAHLIHPYNDCDIIAGQGTTTAELLEDIPDLDVVIVPVGGGGLISGATLAASRYPGVRIIGAEPSGADDAARSLKEGRIVDDVVPDTVADGLRARIGALNFRMIRAGVERIVTVDDPAVLDAMRTIWHTMKLVIEPSSATVLAAARAVRDDVAGLRVGLILSGGNADLDALAFCGHCGWRS